MQLLYKIISSNYSKLHKPIYNWNIAQQCKINIKVHHHLHPAKRIHCRNCIRVLIHSNLLCEHEDLLLAKKNKMTINIKVLYHIEKNNISVEVV